MIRTNEFTRKLFSLILVSMISVFAFAQARQVKGTVKDSSGEPMIGVNVLVKVQLTVLLPISTVISLSTM